jgi:hypothetical protein
MYSHKAPKSRRSKNVKKKTSKLQTYALITFLWMTWTPPFCPTAPVACHSAKAAYLVNSRVLIG